MLAWHAEISWVKGGFARMTIFFVLAGYLATRSLASARDRGAARPFLEFWGRRARRLFPVTALGVAAAVAVTAWWGGPGSTSSVAGDTLSALTSWSNWRFVVEDRSYGAMFEDQSAFQHFWSLSLEEQAFVALPAVLAVVALLTRQVARRPQRAQAVLTATIGAALCALPAMWSQGADTVYYGTHTRGGEFLLGAALALWWRDGTTGHQATRRATAAWRAAGAVGLAVLVAVMLTLDRSADWLYRGGMGLFALPAVAVIGAVLTQGGLVSRALSVAPLRTLGRWAFPVFALHWPIFLALGELLPRAPGWQLVVLELTVSIAVGGLVHVAVEQPLMPGATGRLGAAWARPRFAAPTAVVIAAALLWGSLSVPRAQPSIDFAAAQGVLPGLSVEEAAEILDRPAESAGPPDLTDEDAAAVLAEDGAGRDDLAFRLPGHRAVALFGGSTALTLALGSGPWVASADGHQAIPGYAALGCGLLTDGERGVTGVTESDPLAPRRPPAECEQRAMRWAAAAKLRAIDTAVIVASRMDLVDWKLDGDSEWRAVGDELVDAALLTALEDTVQRFRAVGVERIVVTTAVHVGDSPARDARHLDARRAAAYDRVVRQAAEHLALDVLDLHAWSRALDPAAFDACFPDSWHPTERCSERIWIELIGPTALRLPND